MARMYQSPSASNAYRGDPVSYQGNGGPAFRVKQMPARYKRSPSPENLPTPPDEFDISESDEVSSDGGDEDGGFVAFMDGDDDWRPGMTRARKSNVYRFSKPLTNCLKGDDEGRRPTRTRKPSTRYNNSDQCDEDDEGGRLLHISII